MTKYSPSSIEKKWQEVWDREKIYHPDLKKAANPFYNLMMFPYPSAEGLHVGNMYAFTGTDVYGRFKRMKGFDVFEPIGLDGFGIHSENYAIKKGEHPAAMAKKTEKHFYEQLRLIGNGFAWGNKIETYDPSYYKWTQWIFVKLFKAGLAYRKNAKVNYCPSCKTVLADEQVIKKVTLSERSRGSRAESRETKEGVTFKVEVENSVCERCGTMVEKRDLEQWFFRITSYADRLLSNIEKLDWSEKVKVAQRHWIGKKQGALIKFAVKSSPFKYKEVEVFTTRPDTIFGVTFVVLSPDHPLSLEMAGKRVEVADYLTKHNKEAGSQSDPLQKAEKTGVFSGYYVANPVNNRLLPIWISEYVLLEYGTGAIMGVPGHDSRDFEFAKKHLLPVLRVVKGPQGEKGEIEKSANVWEGEGILINSNFLDNLGTTEAQKSVIEFLQNADLGRFTSTYHLRDWIISRQRYWGPPIPMIYCEKCANDGKSWFDSDEAKVSPSARNLEREGVTFKGEIWNSAGWYPVPEDHLPVLLPDVEDFRPSGEGASPLANISSFYETVCPACGGKARRETDVSDTFLDSSWYFLRYPSVSLDSSVPWDASVTGKWLPVNSYIGGAEHSVLHLLYSRFITMFFNDLGMLDFEEPFIKFRAHGLLIRDGSKMSKSKGNVINPDDYIAKFGADTLRTYLMFLGPFDQGGDFRDTGIAGIYRFLGRVWNIIIETLEGERFDLQRETDPDEHRGNEGRTFKEPRGGSDLLKKELSRVTKKVGDDIENLRFNTAIASLMEFLNLWQKNKESADMDVTSSYIKLLAPFAPFMTEELWQMIKGSNPMTQGTEDRGLDPLKSVHLEAWPTYKEEDLIEDRAVFIVQVNGKVRGRLELNSDAALKRDLVETMGKGLPGVYKFLENKAIKNVIFVPGKLINFVV